MPNLFLFTGEEAFLVHQELTKRKQTFVEKYGEHGLFVFKSNDLDISMIQNALLSGGMFSEKRLIVLRGIPQDTIQHNKVSTKTIDAIHTLLSNNLNSLTDETIVICISYKPDKRTKGYKWCATNMTIKAFPLVDDKQKAIYVEQRCPGLLNDMQKEMFISTAGNSLLHLSNECKKLAAWAQYNNRTLLSNNEIESITVGTAMMNVFSILDHLYTSPPKALKLITQAQENKQDMLRFLGMLYRGLELTLSVTNLYTHGIKEGKQIASLLKAHPFAISKQLKLISVLQEKQSYIVQLYTDLLAIDADIKTGVLPSEGFWIALKSAIQRL